MLILRFADIAAGTALSGLPLHEQVAASVRRAISSGELQPGDLLPTARDLADAFAVHPNTVLRAFRALRDEGTIDLRAGRGARVRSDLAHATRAGVSPRVVLREQADAILVAAAHHGIGLSEVVELLEERDRALAVDGGPTEARRPAQVDPP
jgi:GntR family transcriptional regulator